MKFRTRVTKDGYYLYKPTKGRSRNPVLVKVGHWSNGEFYFTFPQDLLNQEPPRWAIGCVGGNFAGPIPPLTRCRA
jgi:hypothetical protein